MQRTGFARQYRAALLDYLLGSGEAGRDRAYELGRRAIDLNVGLLPLLAIHQKAVSGVLESTRSNVEGLQRLKASDEFLMETMSSFEMVYRGYADLIEHRPHERHSSR